MKFPTMNMNKMFGQDKKKSSKYFWRQLLVSSGIWTPYFAIGIAVGTPTVFIPQMKASGQELTVEMASWLSSTFSYASIPWCFILAFLAGYIGRKKTFILVTLNQVLVAISFYLTTTPIHMIITEVFEGVTSASSMTICIISIVEYTSPENRGVMLTMKSATVYWAIWAANTIGTFTDWKYISVLGFLNAFYSLTVFLWPESPSWLAMKGRYEECRKSHRWLKGCDEYAERELEELIRIQIEERKKKEDTNEKVLKFFIERVFYYPMFLACIMAILYQMTGKQVVSMYALDILKEMTSSESTAYTGMLVLDGVSIVAMYIGCFMCKVFKRRFMLFTFGRSAVLFLLFLSLYLCLVQLSYVSQNTYISLSLLIGYSITIGLGPLILSTSLYGELIPLKYKGRATIIYACVFLIFQSTLLKNTPYILQKFQLHGMFLFYAVSVSICLIILSKYLPETKNKTLQEIENHFKN